jgi:hypothetical protein
MLRRFGLTLCLLAGFAACQQPIAGPARTYLGTGGPSEQPPQLEPRYLLTTAGGYVRSNPPRGIAITFGSNGVRRVGWDDAVEAPGDAVERQVEPSAD